MARTNPAIADKGPDEKSSDYKCSEDFWKMIHTILGGAEAMRKEHQVYLPKFPNESQDDYNYRRKWAPFTNIYMDISKNLASKPFSRETVLKEGAAKSLVDLSDDLDGQGNNLHVFASNLFQRGLDNGIDWILVDYSKAPVDGTRLRSQKEEADLQLRPYWVHIGADRVLAVYSEFAASKEFLIHVRIKEDVVERDGWEEKTTERVRVFNREKRNDGTYAPATFQVFEKQQEPNTLKVNWISIEGPTEIPIGIIPMVPFLTGKRMGTSWQIRPPLRDIAYLQIEEYQQESNLKSALELTCYPMLVGAGIAGKDDKGKEIRVPAGPRAVLFAPMGGSGQHGDWKFIEPNASSLQTLIKHLEDTQTAMRDLGMVPLMVSNLTVITTATVAEKAHSAVHAWALALIDALELAYEYTTLWLKDGSTAPDVDVYLDFAVHIEKHAEIESLLKGEAQGVFSKLTTQLEFKRRGVVAEDFDPKDEAVQLAKEQRGLQGEQAIDPVTGEPVQAPTTPKIVGKLGAPPKPGQPAPAPTKPGTPMTMPPGKGKGAPGMPAA